MTENQRRKFLKLVGAAGIGMALPGISCRPRHDFTKIKNPTRKQLIQRLEKLAGSKAPNDLSYGAMCYVMSRPGPGEPCPACGRLMQAGEMEMWLRAFTAPLASIQAQGVDARLILPEHCATCGYGLGECGLRHWGTQLTLTDEEKNMARKPHLEIRYPDAPDPIRVELDSPDDLEMMAAFLLGKDRYAVERDAEIALKEKLNRLRELFGVAKEK